MKALTLAMFAALSAPAAHADPLAEAGAKAKLCIETAAQKLAKSGERADIVATAAISACDSEVKAVATAVESERGPEAGGRVERLFREKMHGRAVEVVVRLRAG